MPTQHDVDCAFMKNSFDICSCGFYAGSLVPTGHANDCPFLQGVFAVGHAKLIEEGCTCGALKMPPKLPTVFQAASKGLTMSATGPQGKLPMNANNIVDKILIRHTDKYTAYVIWNRENKNAPSNEFMASLEDNESGEQIENGVTRSSVDEATRDAKALFDKRANFFHPSIGGPGTEHSPHCGIYFGGSTCTCGVFPSTARSMARPNLVIVDDFFPNPDEVRRFALQQEFRLSDYHKGRRSNAFRDTVDKADFERLLQRKIIGWEQEGMNGTFQICTAEDPIVYHSDGQTHAGTVYLTPDPPAETGLVLVRSKKTGLRRAPRGNTEEALVLERDTYRGNHFDATKWEIIDRVGNVYNRLVLWDGGLIHAAAGYFGNAADNARLFQMFFFNCE